MFAIGKNTVESMDPKALNQNDAGKSKRLELIESVLAEIFGSVVCWNVQKFFRIFDSDEK